MGDLRVSHVADGASSIRARFLIPDATEQDWVRLGRHLDEDGCMTVSAGGLLVERGERAVLIDAGFGPFSSTPAELDHPSVARMHGGGFPDSLRQLGRSPQDVEAVAITHLHVEHVGWVGNPEPGRSAPAFTRAEVLVSDTERASRQAGYGHLDAWQRATAPAFYARWGEVERAHGGVGQVDLEAARVFFSVDPPADLPERLRQVQAPVLVVAGAQDHATGLAPVTALAGLFPAGRGAVVQDCGHYPWWNDQRPSARPSTPSSTACADPRRALSAAGATAR